MHTWSTLDYTVYRITGDDAETFLQGQISQDVHAVTQTQAQIAAYCNAKGRMHALLLLFRDKDNQLYLRLNNGIAESVIKRLKMFVLRSKVKFEETEFKVIGIEQNTLNKAVNIDNLNDKMFAVTPFENGYFIRMPGIARYECYLLNENVTELSAKLNAIAPENKSTYLALDIQSGFYNIEPATSESILPQTTPIESWGGISYTKGCYVGQEIIARSHYRGKVKRKLMWTTTSSQVNVGDSVYDGESLAGEILMSSFNENEASPYSISAIMSLSYEDKPLLINNETYQFMGIDEGSEGKQ